MNTEPTSRLPGDAPLNPALRKGTDASHGTEFKGTDPMETVSVKDPEEGRNWPLIWAIVAIACVLIAIYYVVA